MSDHKLEAVRACIGAALRKQAGRYATGLDDSVLQRILENARLGRPANVQLTVSVGVNEVVSKADASTVAVPVNRRMTINEPFACDVYLAGSSGPWRERAAKKLDGHVVCDPAKDLRKISEEPDSDNDATRMVPRGVSARSVLFMLEDGCDDLDVVGGLITAAWYHGMSLAAVLGDCPQRETLLAVCGLAGSHVFDSLDDAVDEVQRVLREGPEPPETVPVGPEGMVSPDETTIRLPSGNVLILKYFGHDSTADRIMLHSRSSGASAPMNIDMIVPDPDRETEDSVPGPDGRDVHPVDVHRVRVRHHGPTDTGRGIIPPDFLPPGLSPG